MRTSCEWNFSHFLGCLVFATPVERGCTCACVGGMLNDLQKKAEFCTHACSAVVPLARPTEPALGYSSVHNCMDTCLRWASPLNLQFFVAAFSFHEIGMRRQHALHNSHYLVLHTRPFWYPFKHSFCPRSLGLYSLKNHCDWGQLSWCP